MRHTESRSRTSRMRRAAAIAGTLTLASSGVQLGLSAHVRFENIQVSYHERGFRKRHLTLVSETSLHESNRQSRASAIALLEEVQEYGFTDQAFKVIHHFGQNATMQSYDGYCRKKIASFQENGNNERVCGRLVLVRNAFKAGPFAAHRQMLAYLKLLPQQH
jgi:hypothetical protein